MSIVQSLTVRQRLTWLAHLFKASTQQHHREMIPLLRPLLQPDSVVFDVGAHSGQFARLLAGLVPKGHVYAFEPASYALSLLRYSCAFRRSKNISIYPLGFGDEDAELVLNVPLKRSGSVGFGLSFIGQTDQESRRIVSETIQIKRIDDFVRSHRIDRLSLIKADIEGSEFRMLLGAEETLRTLRPVLFLEVSERYLSRRGDSVAKLSAFLKNLDYAPVSGWADTPISGDVLFVPDQTAAVA